MSETAMVSQRCRMLNPSTCPKARMKRPGSAACAFMRRGQHSSPITGAKMTATNHEATSAKAMTANSEKQYCPGVVRGKADRQKAEKVISVPVSMGKAVEV